MADALGSGGSSTTFFDAGIWHDFGSGVEGRAAVRRGWTVFAGGSFTSGAYAAELMKTGLLGTQDQVGVRVSQPLRIDGGGFSLMLPTAYDYETGQATSLLSRFPLTPSGRELDIEANYRTPLWGGAGWLSANAYLRRQPGHVADAQTDVGAALRFTLGL